MSGQQASQAMHQQISQPISQQINQPMNQPIHGTNGHQMNPPINSPVQSPYIAPQSASHSHSQPISQPVGQTVNHHTNQQLGTPVHHPHTPISSSYDAVRYEPQPQVKRQRLDPSISQSNDQSIDSYLADRRLPVSQSVNTPVSRPTPPPYSQPLIAPDTQRQRQSIYQPRNQPINQSISMSSLLFQFRSILCPSLYGAFESVVQQFHAWNDELHRLRQSSQQANQTPNQSLPLIAPNTQVTIQRILSARYWLRALIEQTVQNPSFHQSKALSSHNQAGSELYADQVYLATQCAQVWPQYLFAVDVPYQPDAQREYSSLDDYLGRFIAEPTFIIGLSTAEAIRSPPLVSESLVKLFDYPFDAFAAMLRSPLALLHLRHYPDIVPLIPAFLAAISARADYYGHASEWKTRSGALIELVTRVRICYTTSGTPFALMGQCKVQSLQHTDQAPPSHPTPVYTSH